MNIEKSNRIESLDLLRGVVILIMALDHVRDFFHAGGMSINPLDPETSSIPLYFSRWITHYCAPVFIFLSGISAGLSGVKKSKNEQSLFLIKRGLWLILLEVTIITFGWTFNPNFNLLVFQVIWAIGASMIALALLIQLPRLIQILVASSIILLHNVIDISELSPTYVSTLLNDLLHHGHFVVYPIIGEHYLLVVYPVLPWIGVMLAGYLMSRIFKFPTQKRFNINFGIGILLVTLFITIRMLHGYGDHNEWHVRETFQQTLMDFLDTEKYPPSLQFILMTIGPALIFLALAEKINLKIYKPIITFGKVPCFFYIIHIYVIHITSVMLFYIQGYTSNDIIPKEGPFWFRPDGLGFGLPGVWLTWLLIGIALYFPCKWFMKIKTTNKHPFLSYL